MLQQILAWAPALFLLCLIAYAVSKVFVRTKNYLEGSDVVYDPEKDVIKLAMKHKGRLTLPEVCSETRLGLEEARATLENLTREGLFPRELTETGANVFVLDDMASLQEKEAAQKLT